MGSYFRCIRSSSHRCLRIIAWTPMGISFSCIRISSHRCRKSITLRSTTMGRSFRCIRSSVLLCKSRFMCVFMDSLCRWMRKSNHWFRGSIACRPMVSSFRCFWRSSNWCRGNKSIGLRLSAAYPAVPESLFNDVDASSISRLWAAHSAYQKL